jgi:hypothetical protein
MKLHSALIQEKFLLGGDRSIIYKNKPNVASSETTIKSYKKKKKREIMLTMIWHIKLT